MSSTSIADRSVEACLTYTVDTGIKPVTGTTGPDGKLRHRSGEFRQHRVTIRDARPCRDQLSLEREGFVFVNHETRVRDFHDSGELTSVYYPEIERLVKKHTGAARVLIFDHTLRSADEAAQAERNLREPVKVVHNDYTARSGIKRLRDHFSSDPDAAEKLLEDVDDLIGQIKKGN